MATTEAKPAEGKPTLHHMNNSQSQRVLWLLEELSLAYPSFSYNLEKHLRITSGKDKVRAPPELKKIHPLGKSPLLATASNRVIAETAAISSYLLSTYDVDHHFSPKDPTAISPDKNANDSIRDESLTSFAGSSMGPVFLLQVFLDILHNQMPFGLRQLVGLLTGGINKMFVNPEMKSMLGYLEGELEGRDWFMGGENPGRADFMLEFPMAMLTQRKWMSLDAYPRVKAWLERCYARPAWKSGIEKGNGYDLGGF